MASVILGSIKVGILGSAERDIIVKRILADNDSAGMDTGLPYGTFKHFGIFKGLGNKLI